MKGEDGGWPAGGEGTLDFQKEKVKEARENENQSWEWQGAGCMCAHARVRACARAGNDCSRKLKTRTQIKH